MIVSRVIGVAAFCAACVLVSGAPQASGPTPYGAYNWSGLYIGGHVGYSWTGVSWIDAGENSGALNSPAGTGGQITDHDLNGWTGGGHLGLQHQWANWVLGAEVSLSGGRLDQTAVSDLSPFDDVHKTSIGSLFLATARLGYAWDRWLTYVKGGYASADVKLSWTDDLVPPDSDQRWRSSKRHNGWTLGAGFEYAVRPDVIIGIEYTYVDLGGETHTNLGQFGAPPPLVSVDADPDALHSVWARLSFKLGRDAPAAAPLK
jgi:outer membrane immunogenic protein